MLIFHLALECERRHSIVFRTNKQHCSLNSNLSCFLKQNMIEISNCCWFLLRFNCMWRWALISWCTSIQGIFRSVVSPLWVFLSSFQFYFLTAQKMQQAQPNGAFRISIRFDIFVNMMQLRSASHGCFVAQMHFFSTSSIIHRKRCCFYFTLCALRERQRTKTRILYDVVNEIIRSSVGH